MSFDVNMAILAGNLTAEPELKQTIQGESVLKFTLAIHRRFAKRGEEQKTDFLNVTAWRQQAEFLARYAHKGDSVYVIGEIQPRSYEDKGGKKQYVVDIVASEVKLVSSKPQEYGAPTQMLPPMEDVANDGTLPF